MNGRELQLGLQGRGSRGASQLLSRRMQMKAQEGIQSHLASPPTTVFKGQMITTFSENTPGKSPSTGAEMRVLDSHGCWPLVSD